MISSGSIGIESTGLEREGSDKNGGGFTESYVPDKGRFGRLGAYPGIGSVTQTMA